MNLIARLSADHRLLGWCIVIALSIPPILGYAGYRIADPVAEGWVDAEVIEELRAAEDTFKFNAPLVLVLECDDFFTPERVAALHATADAIRNLDPVENLVWMGDLPDVTLRGQETPILPKANDITAESLAGAKERLLEHPLSRDGLISAEGTTALFLVDVSEREDVQPVLKAARKILDTVGIKTRSTGGLALYEVHDRMLAKAHIRVQALSYCLVTALSIIIFRRPAAIIIAAAGPFVGLTWTIGWLFLLGQSENELAKIILPVMVIMIGFTDGVHMVVRIRQQRAAGRTARDSVFDAVSHIGPACFLTSVTTAIGFGSLMVSNAEMIAGFGRVSAIGVVVTFLSVVLVAPLLANSPLGSRMHVNTAKDSIYNLMSRCVWVVDFASRHAKPVTAFGFALTALCLYFCTNLVPDDRISDRIPHSSEEYQAMIHSDQHMGGIRYLRLIISWDVPTFEEIDSGAEEVVSRDQIWPVIKGCEEILAQEELVGPSTSIRTTLTVFKGPDRRDQHFLAGKLPDELKGQFYRPEIGKTQVAARLQDFGIAKLDPVFERIDAAIDGLEKEHPEFQIELFSDQLIEGRVVRQMIEELMKSLAVASLIIFTVLAIAFRSLRVGLISIMPNIMPLVAAGALRLVINERLGIASACAFAICLGIAVDDTIHYLMQFRHERSLGRSPQEANRATFVSVGSALMMTTVVMTAGLGTVMTSGMPPHVNFAAMGCTTLLAALFADLLFLPALLTLFPGRKSPAEEQPKEVQLTNGTD